MPSKKENEDLLEKERKRRDEIFWLGREKGFKFKVGGLAVKVYSQKNKGYYLTLQRRHGPSMR
jgi:hypothetical protein